MSRPERLLIISHLWPGNPQSSNPLSGIYVKEQVSAIRKIIDADIIVPVALLPKLSLFAMNYRKAAAELFRRVSFSDEEIVPVKYLPLLGKHGNAFVIALSASGRCSKGTLIHAHTLFPDGLAAAILSKLKRVKYVVTLHGSEVMLIDNKPVNKALAKFICNNSSAVISVSSKMAEKIRRITHREDGIYVIRNGIEKMFQKTSGEKAFLFVGKLIDVKDPVMLLEAFKIFHMNNKEWKLIIVGDGPLRSKLESRAEQMRIIESIEFAGYVGRDEIGKYYSRSHSLVISSRSEGFPTVIYEAMSAGLPVLSYDIGGVKEAVVDRVNGIISKERSAESLASIMAESSKTDWNRDLIRSDASNYTYDKLAGKITEIYKSII